MYVPTVGNQRFLADLQQLHVREGNYSSVSQSSVSQAVWQPLFTALNSSREWETIVFFVEFLYAWYLVLRIVCK